MPYRLFVPEGAEAGKTYPLVLFLHGGERGDDNEKQITANQGPTIWAKPEEQAKRPCFVLAPQARNAADGGFGITRDAEDVSAVYVTNGGNLTLKNPTINTSGNTSSQINSSFYGLNAAVLATKGSALTITAAQSAPPAPTRMGRFQPIVMSGRHLHQVKLRKTPGKLIPGSVTKNTSRMWRLIMMTEIFCDVNAHTKRLSEFPTFRLSQVPERVIRIGAKSNTFSFRHTRSVTSAVVGK